MRDTRGVARVNASFTMDLPPDQAQAMFVRDLLPDLHNDGGFVLYEERPGRLELSKGVVEDSPTASRSSPTRTSLITRGSRGTRAETRRAGSSHRCLPGRAGRPPGSPRAAGLLGRAPLDLAPAGRRVRPGRNGHARDAQRPCRTRRSRRPGSPRLARALARDRERPARLSPPGRRTRRRAQSARTSRTIAINAITTAST